MSRRRKLVVFAALCSAALGLAVVQSRADAAPRARVAARDTAECDGDIASIDVARLVPICVAQLEALRDADTARELFFGVVRAGEVEAIATLLDCGVPVDVRGGSGRTALHLAAYHGQDALVLLLLARGADVEVRDAAGLTPLMNAAFRGHTAIVGALLGAGAQVDASNHVGQTAAMFAALFGRTDTLALLTAHGADLERRDRLGLSASRLTAASRPAGVVEAFLRAGVREAREALGAARVAVE